jgi:hypothetical protein
MAEEVSMKEPVSSNERYSQARLIDELNDYDRSMPVAVWEGICKMAADEIERLQAQVDALMLEHCPKEMTAAQLQLWAASQRPVVEPLAERVSTSACIHKGKWVSIEDYKRVAEAYERLTFGRPVEPPVVGWQPIETAPVESDQPILMTDGKWFAAGYVGRDQFHKYRISHFAVCQEYEWEPTHWMPAPSLTKGTEL